MSSDFDAVYSWNVCGNLKSRTKSLKPPILRFNVVQGHWCWYPQKARQQCLLWYVSKSVSICDRSLAKLVDSSRNRAFWRGYPNFMHSCGRLLNVGSRNLHRWNLRLMLNISYAGCPGLSQMVSAQFSPEMCIAAWNHEKFTKNPNSGGSTLFEVIGVGTTGKIVSSVVTIYSKSVSICNRSHARQASSGKITIS